MGESIVERMNRLAAERKLKERNSLQEIPIAVSTSETLTDKDEQRRARTHRLVQIGALTDHYLCTGELLPEEVGRVLAVMMENQEVKRIIQKAVE